MKATYPPDAWEKLSDQLTAARRQRLEQAASKRTEMVRLVLQDVHNPHNISACIRSAEAFGVQHIHVVAPGERFKASTVARGVSGWLDIHTHTSIADCALTLSREGYKLTGAIPRQDAVPLREIPCEQPIALLFGNEHAGLSPEWQEHIDFYFTIPMVGLVESMNISVCAAIALENTTQRMQGLHGQAYFLNSEKQTSLLSRWVCESVTAWDKIYQRKSTPL